MREKAYSRGITSSYLEGRDDEEDEEDDSFSINAIKNRYNPKKDASEWMLQNEIVIHMCLVDGLL